MKKQTLVSAAVSAAAMMPLLGASGLVSATGTETISVSTTTASGGTETCYIYDSAASSFRTPCESSWGSYDSEAKTLTLGPGINADELEKSISIQLESPFTINSTSDIKADITGPLTPVETATFAFGQYSLTGKIGGFNNSSLVIDNGTYHIDSLYVGDLTINNGTIESDYNIRLSGSLVMDGGSVVAKEIRANNIIISGGEINIDGDNEYYGLGLALDATGNIKIDGGDITVKGPSGLISHGEGIININDGTISLIGSGIAAFGINSDEGKNIIINGGDLTIDGFEWGISGRGNKIYFNGGTTTIKNSTEHTIWITDATDPENDIVFSDGMGINGNTYVFYNDDSTGIADPGEVIIASGYTYRKHYGWETIDGDDMPIPDTSGSPKTPDTGAFSSTSDNATIIVVSLGLLATISGAAYLATYIFNRRSNKVKFSRNDRLDD